MAVGTQRSAWNKTRSHELAIPHGSSMARPVEDAARSFVERVLAMVLHMKKDDPKSCDTVQVLPFDDLYGLALRLFTARKEFRELGHSESRPKISKFPFLSTIFHFLCHS
jgi:hypothetical protein